MGGFERISIVGVILLSLGVEAGAADMFGAPAMQAPDLSGVRTEYGTGWYLRGSASVSREQAPVVSADVAAKPTTLGRSLELGFGYQFNRWFRADITGNWGASTKLNQTGGTVTCPYGLVTVTDPVFGPIGFLWNNILDTCRPVQTGSLGKFDLLLNGYVDLGTWSGLTPYVGAGIGVSSIRSTAALNYYKTTDGSVYSANLSAIGVTPPLWVNFAGNYLNPQPKVGFGVQNWARTARKTTNNVAWALMAGVAYDLNENAKLDIGYRYINSGSYTSIASPITGLTKTSAITSQELRMGFRYMID